MDRSHRLRETYDVVRTRSRGASSASGPLVARIHPNNLEPPANRYTVVAGKRIGKAHDRNRSKRITREALRMLDHRLEPGFDIVVIVRGGISEMPVRDAAERSLVEIFRKAGLLRDG